jgi:6-phosphogluconolactonase
MDDLSTAVGDFVVNAAARAVAARRSFFVALSGGTVMTVLGSMLAIEPRRSLIDWRGWHVFWADERAVPPESPDSNYGIARRLLLERVPLPREQIHAVNFAEGTVEAARSYEEIMAREFDTPSGRWPRFDLILLGVGDDSHTASLFPGHGAVNETRRTVVPVFDAPKDPPERVTLTLPVINNARHILFVVAGRNKRTIVSRLFGPPSRILLPAARVAPVSGEIRWFMDDDAAGSL